MQFKTTIVAVAVSLLMMGCGDSDTPTNTRNANVANASANANSPSNVANTGLETTKKPDTGATNAAPTLGPVVVAYYDALKNKDAAAVRKVMAAEYLKKTEEDMKAEKKTDIVAFLTEFDKLPENKMEVRNEQITGSRGTVEVNGGAYSGWPKLVLVNEGGSWKITNEVP
jgi:ABC-type enterochelin transport system substrate-binding protein